MFYVKWIWKRIEERKFLYLLALLCLLGESIALISITGLQKFMIDDIFLQMNFSIFNQVLFWFSCACLTYVVLIVLSNFMLVYIQYKVNADLNIKTILQFYRIDYSVFEKMSTEKVVNHFSQDIRMISQTLSEKVLRLFISFMQIIVLSVILLNINLWFLIIVVISSFLFIYVNKYFSGIIQKNAVKIMETGTDVVVHIEKVLYITKEIIAYHRHKWESSIYNQLYNKYFAQILKKSRLEKKKVYATEPIRIGLSIFVLFYGGFEVMRGNLSIGLLVISYQFVTQLMDSFYNISNQYTEMVATFANIDRLESLTKQNKIEDGNIPLSEKVNRIKLNNVSFQYDNQKVLNNISFALPIGKKIAIVGPSGSGKTTILKLFLRLIEPTAGRIEINGIDLSNIRREDWAQKIKVIAQDPYYFPDTIETNIVLGRNPSLSQLINACKLAQIDEFIQQLPDGFKTTIGERGVTLSGGQLQRLSIARAVLEQPEILVLDEATSSLDYETERKFQQSLDRARAGLTTIIVAHRLSTIMNSDMILVLDDGKIVEHGTYEELKQAGGLFNKMLQSNKLVELR